MLYLEKQDHNVQNWNNGLLEKWMEISLIGCTDQAKDSWITNKSVKSDIDWFNAGIYIVNEISFSNSDIIRKRLICDRRDTSWCKWIHSSWLLPYLVTESVWLICSGFLELTCSLWLLVAVKPLFTGGSLLLSNKDWRVLV